MRGIVAAMASAIVALGIAGAPTAAAAPAALSAGELTAKLERVLNTGLPDGERAAELEGGLAAIPTANNIGNTMDTYASMFDWTVQNPSLAGDQLNAQLAVTVPLFGTRTHDIYWIDQDGTWKLSNASACVIANDAVGVACTI